MAENRQREELTRAEARVAHAIAGTVEWLLRCIVVLALLAVAGVAIGNGALVARCLLAIATLAAVARGAKGPLGRGRSSVM